MPAISSFKMTFALTALTIVKSVNHSRSVLNAAQEPNLLAQELASAAISISKTVNLTNANPAMNHARLVKTHHRA